MPRLYHRDPPPTASPRFWFGASTIGAEWWEQVHHRPRLRKMVFLSRSAVIEGYFTEAAIEFNTNGFNGAIDFAEPDAEQWMSCEVRIRVPGFEANYACAIQRPELELLRAQLDQLNRSVGQAEASAEWSAMEKGISLRFSLNRLGHVKGGYELRSRSDGPTLRGDFDADQTHLRLWVWQLDSALDQRAAG